MKRQNPGYHSVKSAIAMLLSLLSVLVLIIGCSGGEAEHQAFNYRADRVVSGQISLIDSALFQADFVVASDWKSGFVGNITITNKGDSRINNWKLEFDFDRKITGIWSARLLENSDSHYIIGGESWNSWLEPGQSVTFGFQGSPGNVTSEPQNVELYGELPWVEPSPGVSPDASGGDVVISYKTQSDWGSGFTGNITIENKGTSSYNDWVLEFEFDRKIDSIWNGSIVKKQGVKYEISGVEWNRNLPAGRSISFGFTGSPGNVSAGPANYTFGRAGQPAPSPSPEINPSPVPSATPEPSPSPSVSPVPAGDKRVVAYFVNWGIYDRNYQVTDIPADRVTHINYAFFSVNADSNSIELFDPWADVQKVFTGAAHLGFPDQTWDESARGEAGNLGRLRQLKNIYPHIKTLISVGGWTLSYNFPKVASTQQSREQFAASCVDNMVRYGFDGVDIDWEYPGPGDKTNCTLLFRELRRQLDMRGAVDNTHYLLTMAGPAGYDKLINLELSQLGESMDFINIMNYDYHGGWDNSTNHHSPLYMNPQDPINPVDRELLNTDWTVNYYIDAGVPPEKLSLGVPFYGRAWEQVSSSNYGLFQNGPSLPFTNQRGNWEPGMIDYWRIQELLSSGSDYQVHWDGDSQVPWIYGKNLTPTKPDGGMFITYENVQSARNKVDYLKSKGLGGIMFWELSGDCRDAGNPQSLLNSIHDQLNR